MPYLSYLRIYSRVTTIFELLKNDSYICRQWYITGCTLFQNFATGVIVAFPAVLTPAITADDSDIHATRDEASWIAAAYSFSGIASFLILPALLQIYGRKCFHFFANLFTLIGSVMIVYATNVAFLITGRIVQGFSFGAMFMTCEVIAEMVHPKRRGFFIAFKLLVLDVGILTCHGLGAILTWRQIIWLAVVPSIVGALSTLTWPESPYWLAYKERYDESAAAFEWLRGNDSEAKRELRALILTQKELIRLNIDYNNNTFRSILEAFRNPAFLKPFFIGSLFTIIMHAFGLHYLLAYIIEIMTTLSGDKAKAFYYSLAFDAMKIVAAISACVTVRIFKRKSILFLAGVSSCLALTSLCICNYLEEKGLLSLKWLTPLLLIAHNVFCYAGYVPISVVIKGEIFPRQYKGLATTCAGIVDALCSIATIKLTATMLSSLRVYGTFAVYVAISSACLFCLYLILPETKDRTLLSIEADFLGLKLGDIDDENVIIELNEIKPKVVKAT